MSRAHMMVCAALLSTLSVEARAQSNSYYVGELIAVANSYCPRNTVPAAGQVLQVSQYALLSTLLGNTYGGDGERTFQLPDLRGRVPLGAAEPGPKLGGTGGAQHQQIDLPPKSAGATPVDIQGTPYLTINWCIVTWGVFPESAR